MEADDQSKKETQLEFREPTLDDLARLCDWLNTEHAKYVVVGGFAVRAAGYNRRTMDIDLLIDTSPENEAAVFRALSHLPDQAVSEARVGDVHEYGVLRVGDEFIVDLMKSGCGVHYQDAIQDADVRHVDGVDIPFASVPTLWRMKQTLREKDNADKLFLRQWAEHNNVTLDPLPRSPASEPEIPAWFIKLQDWLFRKRR